jgi:hypothetical protein
MTLCSLLGAIGQTQSDLLAVAPAKSVVHISSVLRLACFGHFDNCLYLLLSSKICTLVDVLSHHLAMLVPDATINFALISCTNMFKLPYCPTASSLMDLLAIILSTLAVVEGDKKHCNAISSSSEVLLCQTTDIVSYIVGLGILDKLSQYLNNVHGPIDIDNLTGVEYLQHALALISAIIRLAARRYGDVVDKKKGDDPTQLIATLKATQLVGIVSLMYGMLLHTDAPARSDNAPPCLSAHTLSIVESAFNLLNNVASLNLSLLQVLHHYM